MHLQAADQQSLTDDGPQSSGRMLLHQGCDSYGEAQRAIETVTTSADVAVAVVVVAVAVAVAAGGGGGVVVVVVVVLHLSHMTLQNAPIQLLHPFLPLLPPPPAPRPSQGQESPSSL